MPQLNPGPWFAIFLSSWIIYLTILAPKMSNFKHQNEPKLQDINKENPKPWNWPWI